MELPKSINPCPIVEAVFEIRFDAVIPEDAVFGTLYNKFKKEFPELEKLPILQLPEQIRSTDANLKYSPHYRLKKENFMLQLGPRVFSLVNVKEYCGWEVFSKRIFSIYEKMMETEIINEIKRVGLRYINMFPQTNIFEQSNLKISLNESVLNSQKMNIIAEIPIDECVSQLRIVNKADVSINNKVITGSLVDIDTVFVGDFANYKEAIEKAHNEEKRLFYSLLDESFIKSLNPIY